MSRIYLVRHPKTTVNLAVPSHQWPLSPTGREQAEQLAKESFWPRVSMIYSSEEPKATSTTRIIAALTGVSWQTSSCLGELDRSSFQPPDIAAYRSGHARMFGTPYQQVRGWGEPCSRGRTHCYLCAKTCR